jgi:DNA-binding TFAR19-related protein (PDSD5 family)
MSDSELAAIRKKKLREIQKRFSAKQTPPDTSGPKDVLNKIFKDRAWEVFNSATVQFPVEMSKVKKILTELAVSGKITQVTGEELFVFLKKLGLDVKLNTTITYASHGQLKTLEEKMKEELTKT